MSYTPPTAEISLLGSNQRLDESQRPSSLSLAHRKSDESFTIDKLQFDKCDFLGREQELKVLQEKYQQAQKVPSKQIVLIGGEPGVGKSALAQEVRKTVATSAGFFICGKFKYDYNQPYGAIIEACDLLCEILSDPPKRYSFSNRDVQKQFCTSLTKESLELLEIVLPKIQQLQHNIKASDERTETPTHVVNYAQLGPAFHEAFSQFFKTASLFGTIALVIDDVQWADQASLDMLEALMKDPKLDSLFLVTTYRSDEMGDSHEFRQVVERVKQRTGAISAAITELKLQNVIQAVVEDFLASLISSTDEDIVALAKLVHFKTGGNMFYVKQFLTMLTASKHMVFDLGSFKWKWNLASIQSDAMATENVVSMLLARLQEFPEELQTLLPRAACLGTIFSSASLEIVIRHYCNNIGDLNLMYEKYQGKIGNEATTTDGSSVLTITGILEHERLLRTLKAGVYHWEHDKIREALFQLVDQSELDDIQFEVGSLLFEELSCDELSEHLFSVVHLLNTRADRLGMEDKLRLEIAGLNLRAGNTALASSAFKLSTEYLAKGLALLPEDSLKTNEKLALDFYSSLAEGCFCIGQHEKVNEIYVLLAKQKTITLLDKRRVSIAHLDSLSAQGRTAEAKDLTLHLLEQLGCSFPKHQRFLFTMAGVLRTSAGMDRSIARIKQLGPISDPSKVWVVYLIDRLGTVAYQCDPKLMPLAFLKGLRWTLNNGIADMTAPLLARIGILLVSVGDYASAKKYADLSLTFTSRQNESRTLFLCYQFVMRMQAPLETCKKPLLRAYNIGLATGDLYSAFWSIFFLTEFSIFTGTKLPLILEDFSKYVAQMESLKLSKHVLCSKISWQLVLNLAQRDGKHILGGEVLDINAVISLVTGNIRYEVEFRHLCRTRLACAFWFDDFQQVGSLMELAGYDAFRAEKEKPGLAHHGQMYIYCALSCISVARSLQDSGGKRKRQELAGKFLSRLKSWSSRGNIAVQYAESLIQAELASLDGNLAEAKKDYEVAILLAGRNGFTNYQGLAHERCAAHAFRIGDNNEARYHYRRALDLYSEWGALGKVSHLEPLICNLMAEETDVFHVICESSFEFTADSKQEHS